MNKINKISSTMSLSINNTQKTYSFALLTTYLFMRRFTEILICRSWGLLWMFYRYEWRSNSFANILHRVNLSEILITSKFKRVCNITLSPRSSKMFKLRSWAFIEVQITRFFIPITNTTTPKEDAHSSRHLGLVLYQASFVFGL